MKILINQRGGLGNQLFQYAAGLYFAEKYMATLEIITRDEWSYGHPRPFLLSKFSISTPYRHLNYLDAKLGTWTLRNAPLRKLLGAKFHDFDYQILWGFQPSLPLASRARRLYVNGYFQAYQYSQSVERQLRSELVLREAPRGRNVETLRQIQNCECAVSLHVRRGDYTKEWSGSSILPMTYYDKAINAICEAHANPTFFVFSDDIPFARENLPKLDRVFFVDHNNEEAATEDLRLMSACRHHITANSSFSWWGAWLNPSTEKHVLVPDRWPNLMSPPPDLIPPEWRIVSA
jgi:hypothetical protein